MRRRLIVPTALIALVGLIAGFATAAQATPSKSTACTNCHSGPAVPIAATPVSTSGTNATYSFSAPGADAVAIFDGSIKLYTFTTGTGQFTVAAGKTYSLYAVAGPGTGDGVSRITISPAAAPVDSAAPVTTSDAKASYVSSALIKLAATDAGSGVAATYYALDGAAQVAGTSVSVTAPGTHSLAFWSVDVAGNVEARKTVSFTITVPAPVDATAPVTTSDATASYVSSALIKLAATDAGSGVAATYYALDGAAQVAGTSVSVTAPGTHSLAFWSVDVAGNVEARKTVSFTITVPAPDPTPVPDPTPSPEPTPTPVPAPTVSVVKVQLTRYAAGKTATLTDTSSGAKYTAVVGAKGIVVFKNVPAGTYRLSYSGKRGAVVIRTIRVRAATRGDHDRGDERNHRHERNSHERDDD
jgi:hypothetical protein